MKDITKEEFLSSSLDKISKVYMGKRHHCRCGCGGQYVSTSYSNDKNQIVDDELVRKKLIRAKKLVEKGADCFAGGTFFDVETGKNKTLTFYFDDI